MSLSLATIAVIVNVVLLVLAACLIYQYLHRRAAQTEELRLQKLALEHEVEDRTR